MRKIFLLVALILACSIPGHAQVVFNTVPVLDPTNVVLFNTTSGQTITNTAPFYIISVPIGMTNFSFQISATLNTDGMGVAVHCTPDNSTNVPPYGISTNGITNSPFIPYSTYNGSATFGNFNTNITMIAGTPTLISFSTVGCEAIAIKFQLFTGTLTDTIRVQGSFSTSSPGGIYPGGPQAVLMMGASGGGAFQPIQISSSSGILAYASGAVPSPIGSSIRSFAQATASNGQLVTPITVSNIGNFSHITGTTATSLGANGAAGLFHNVTINTSAAGTISFFDLANASCTGTPATNTIAVITVAAAAAPVTLTYDAAYVNGLCVKASVAMDFTVSAQ
jgi:hypothetical protein